MPEPEIDNRIVTPHDRAFRKAMALPEVAKAFFDYHLPASLRNRLDLNSIRFEPCTFVDERLKLSICDVVFKARIGGREAYCSVIIEHQSTAQKLMPLRIMRYIINAMEYAAEQGKKSNIEKPLPLVVPIVFYHDKKAYPYTCDIKELIDAPLDLIDAIWGKPFHLVDLSQIPDEALRERAWIGVVDYVFKHIKDREFYNAFSTILPYLLSLEGKNSTKLERTMLKYIETAGNIEPNLFLEALKAHDVSEEVRGDLVTVIEHAKKEGLEKGLEQGLEQGFERGREETQTAIARNLLANGIPLAVVIKSVPLSAETLQAIKQQLERSH